MEDNQKVQQVLPIQPTHKYLPIKRNISNGQMIIELILNLQLLEFTTILLEILLYLQDRIHLVL
jgi:hypothetical protein